MATWLLLRLLDLRLLEFSDSFSYRCCHRQYRM